ncbi:MAG: hypothetical protein OSB60_10130 [Myxococcota bacterium]|jgi:hypothetical protein|nr:hypothetical protein [Myxococcota bacterium]
MTISNRTRTTRIFSQNSRNAFACLMFLIVALGSSVGIASTATAENRMGGTHQTTNEVVLNAPTAEVTSALDMRDDEYNTDLIFGMTKGVAASTMIPAIKPLFLLLTIPLDLAFLPFAAIGGFF